MMVKAFASRLLITLSWGTLLANALEMPNIKDCPALPRRLSGPENVTDLRADDIKVVAAMGDSIVAGAFMLGMNAEEEGLDINSFSESRGESYAIGGNSDAVTLAKFIQHYSPTVRGASIGSRFPTTPCVDDDCSILSYEYRPLRDRLNAAISGSMAINLDRQLDYLITRMKTMIGVNFHRDWKMITIQVGSNDQCASCAGALDVSPEAYGNYVSAALERIRDNIPRVIVNLLGTFKVSQVYAITEDGPEYCRPQNDDPNTILNRAMCSCFQGADSNRTQMDTLSEGYNAKLQEIYEQFKSEQSDTFAVSYMPGNINILGFPIEALSNFDCFHPSLINHQWIAKTSWELLFATEEERQATWEFDGDKSVYCPTETDRIRIN
ncbi:hypothetical protein BDB00DRAFT_810723 [Zychaea mexicana]|uniref:uncharacterized protein n=1 Tax=Zychaea mexicana TaxID=64656 RepID=UPI0022FDFF27|nr:uncharacterized protein BDB00DRAFT_810723 [Zychaea mexicana]KAI9496151.1 hypothetical protein BDB00DRAFT_810723 [Zychaea mexicana]